MGIAQAFIGRNLGGKNIKQWKLYKDQKIFHSLYELRYTEKNLELVHIWNHDAILQKSVCSNTNMAQKIFLIGASKENSVLFQLQCLVCPQAMGGRSSSNRCGYAILLWIIYFFATNARMCFSHHFTKMHQHLFLAQVAQNSVCAECEMDTQAKNITFVSHSALFPLGTKYTTLFSGSA